MAIPAHEVLIKAVDFVKRDVTFIPPKGQVTERLHASVNEIDYGLLTNGTEFYDTRNKRGGGGTVDLVMYLHQPTFAARWSTCGT